MKAQVRSRTRYARRAWKVVWRTNERRVLGCGSVGWRLSCGGYEISQLSRVRLDMSLKAQGMRAARVGGYGMAADVGLVVWL